VGLAALAALVVWGRDRIHFDFGVFRSQLAQADWRKIAIALGCIYVCYVIRSVRWALLLRHNKKVPLLSLLGTQVIGFTAVALIGRIADPVRPYLVAKKTGLPLSNQVAVYIVERLFDLASMALIFCSMILLAPAGALPHPEVLKKVCYGALAATVGGAGSSAWPPRNWATPSGTRFAPFAPAWTPCAPSQILPLSWRCHWPCGG